MIKDATFAVLKEPSLEVLFIPGASTEGARATGLVMQIRCPILCVRLEAKTSSSLAKCGVKNTRSSFIKTAPQERDNREGHHASGRELRIYL